MSVKKVSVQESVDDHEELLQGINDAFFEDVYYNEYPKETRLYNTLLSVMKLWEEGKKKCTQ